MSRWELMKEAWKRRDPVSSADIVSGIRAGTIKVLQPAVQAGAQFREARPDVAERISRTHAARQIQKSVQLRKDIDTTKRRIISSEKNIVLLETRIDKAPVRNGIFTGTDEQFIQHEKDVKAYNTNVKQFNTSNKRIAALEGKKFIPKLERSVSSYIPTLANISKKGAQFRVKHPQVAAKIYSTFEKAHTKTERVGTQSQRNALAGYTYGSYSSLQRQPVKTAASFAVGGASVKAIRMIGLVGKAYDAGSKAKRMAQAAQYGILAYYGVKSAEHIMSAPNSYEAGQRAANIMYTEVLPMAAGIKAVGVAPKVARVVTRKAGFISKKFKVGTKKMLSDNRAQALAGKTQKQRLAELEKTEKARLGRELFESEYEAIKKLVGTKQPKAPRTVKTAKDIFKKIDAASQQKVDSGKYKGVKQKDGTVLLVKVIQKPLTKTVVKGKVAQKQHAEIMQTTWGVKPYASTQTISYAEHIKLVTRSTGYYMRRAKAAQKAKLKQISIQNAKLEQQVKSKQITKTVYAQQVQKLKAKVDLIIKALVIPKVKTRTVSEFSAGVLAISAIKQKFEQVAVQVAKQKAEQVPKQKAKQKQKAALLIAQKPKAVTVAKEKLIAKKAAAEKVTQKTPRKVTPKPPRKPALKMPKLIIPSVGPPPKRKVKKKPIRKDKQVVTYTPTQIKNRVATIASLFG